MLHLIFGNFETQLNSFNMKSTLLSIILLGIFTYVNAQNDAYHNTLFNQLQTDYGLTGGGWLLTPNEATNASNAISYGNTTTQNTVTGQDFSLAINMDVASTGNNPWDAGYFIPNVNPVQQGQRVLLVIWLRRVSANPTDKGKLNLFVEHHQTFHKEVILTINPTTQWQQYFIPFEASDNYTAGELNTGFHLAYQQQEIEYGGMALVNYGTSYTLNDLPSVLHNDYYEGSEPNASWRAPAASRIEQHRKADLQLQVLDAAGNPVPNAPVRVEMIRHKYAFGTAVVTSRFPGNPQYNATYVSKLQDLDGNGHGFNWVVTENALKWNAWENNWIGTPSETINALNYLTNQKIKIRGHVLIWPGWSFMPADMQANANNPQHLKNRIDNRLIGKLNTSGIRQNIKEWDVINEIAHVRDLEYALQGTTSYTTGREIYTEIFNKAHQQDNALVGYVNDYNILSNGSVVGGDYQLYKSMIQEIINSGGQVDGIGFQAHMGTNMTAIDSLYAILEDCYQTFGKDIKITEFDMSDVIVDSTAARYMGDFLTMMFSHPSTNGFLMWGFWDGAHWLGNAPLFDINWTPKPSLTTFNNLVFTEWWTDSTLTTDANGNLTIRGFKGDYRISTTINSELVVADLVLYDDLNTTVQLFPVNTISILNDVDFKVFPNPAYDIINVELPSEGDWSVTLVDKLGRVLIATILNGKKGRLDISAFDDGVYFLKIENKEGEIGVHKILKMD